MEKTIVFYDKKKQLEKGFPGACFLRYGIFKRGFLH
jgi:hypothetical protein